MESPGKDMRELEAQLDRLGTHQKLPGLQVTFADTGSGSATEAAGSTGDGAAGGAEKKELTKAERKALFEAQRAAQGGGDEKKALSKAERRAQQEAQRQQERRSLSTLVPNTMSPIPGVENKLLKKLKTQKEK